MSNSLIECSGALCLIIVNIPNVPVDWIPASWLVDWIQSKTFTAPFQIKYICMKLSNLEDLSSFYPLYFDINPITQQMTF